MDRKYVYLLSSPHGGSTLLTLVLGKHPMFAGLGEVSFMPKLLALKELCTCGEVLADCERWSGVFDEFKSVTGCDLRTSPYGRFLGDALKSKSGSGLIDHNYQTRWRYFLGKSRGAIDTAALFFTPKGLGIRAATLPSVKESVKNTLTLYEAAANQWSAKVVVDASKLPRKAPHLYAADPSRVRILHLTRDGRGVVTSRKKYMPVAMAAERWNHYHRISRRFLTRWVDPEHQYRVTYEQFVADPEQTLHGIMDWLGVPYASECLDFSDNAVMHSAGGNPARFRLSGGITKVDDRWRNELTEEDLQVFESQAGRLNRELGYV